MRRLSAVIFILYSFSLSAEWFSASGTAVIFDDNRQLARQQAARQALRDVLQQADISLAALSVINTEPLGDELFTLSAGLPVLQIVLLEEDERDNRLSITLKADVWPQASLCPDRTLSKAVLLTAFNLAEGATQVAQSNTGLAAEVSRRFANTLQHAQADFLLKQGAAYSLPAVDKLQSAFAQQQLQNMAQAAQAQFIVSGQLRNLSFGVQPGNLLSKKSWTRQFALDVSVMDGTSGALIQNKTYQTRTLWPVPLTTPIDSGSDQLWHSDYGVEVQRLLRDAVDDIAQTLACTPVKAQVVRVVPQGVAISAGSRQGVKSGDIFRLFYSDSFTDSWGNQYRQLTQDSIELEVTQVYPDHALTRALTQHSVLPVQVRDLVQIAGLKERKYAN
ncbi:MAG TPA: flagellar assembly protein T N-terminal domain-containing protein [Rheinheimera sp.]|uniref:flagellar assembly protein T N-terminal domain-containing protein n=1 Tax=Rheinheimera sp. TaxID=1869214 RepID=UPI002F931292